MPLEISIRADIKAITNSLAAMAYKQLPFAQAQAVNSLAKRVKESEVTNIKTTFPTATPFTANSVSMQKARKDNPTATVFLKDIAAQYLQPYETGGTHFLGTKKGLLVPIDQATNQYGNIPKGILASLKGRTDIFVGPVKIKSGIINGVWQRIATTAIKNTKIANKRGKMVRMRKLNTSGHLKLLIRFEDPKEVTQHLGWGSTAKSIISNNFKKDFDTAMDKALATAK